MRRKKRPIPEVWKMFQEGKLSSNDLDWIGRTDPAKQMASAKKCGKANPTFVIHQLNRSTITHGKA